MNNTKKILNAVLIFALFTQITHAQSLFAQFSKETSFIASVTSWVFALSLESSIYIFALRGRKTVALFFGLVSFLINIFYYSPNIGISKELFVTTLLSCIIPITIWFFTEEVEKDFDKPVGRPKGSKNRSKEDDNEQTETVVEPISENSFEAIVRKRGRPKKFENVLESELG